MGNIIRVTTEDGKEVARASHGLGCFAYLSQVGERYAGTFPFAGVANNPALINQWLEKVEKTAPPEDTLVVQIFLCDSLKLFADGEGSDLRNLESAIAKYPQHMQDGPRRILESYLSLLKKYRTITLRYTNEVFTSFTVTSAGANAKPR
jgi:hypothetical protein